METTKRGAMGLALQSSHTEQLPGTFVPVAPAGFPAPKLVAFNEDLATELGLDAAALRSTMAEVVAGNRTPEGARPIALAYAGHQFGYFSPLLGDGRALLLGELVGGGGERHDLQLKGSGPTPFSRGGDGYAALGPVLREFLVSEAMHHLGVSTTRSLAAITTGQNIYRDRPLPGAVLARTARSHLRVGTFELFGRRGDRETVRKLARYALERHYPEARKEGETVETALLRAVAEAQGKLIADWMRVGFVHGVMNTDNVSVAGETLDYGPCAFLDHYVPTTVFSSIDETGRYAFDNQAAIGQWNLARFAEVLLPLLHPDPERAMEIAEDCLTLQQRAFDAHFRSGMLAKLGIVAPRKEDTELLYSVLSYLEAERLDYTEFFRGLSEKLRNDAAIDAPMWVAWKKRVLCDGENPQNVATRMEAVNPLYIPRNHKVEEALSAALEGNLAPFETLLSLVRNPFLDHGVDPSYTQPAPPSFGPYRTFCGT